MRSKIGALTPLSNSISTIAGSMSEVASIFLICGVMCSDASLATKNIVENEYVPVTELRPNPEKSKNEFLA